MNARHAVTLTLIVAAMVTCVIMLLAAEPKPTQTHYGNPADAIAAAVAKKYP